MRNPEVAEAILAQVTTPERAASIAGDLWESAGPGGVRRFWGDVARVASSMVWQDVAASPGPIAKLAFRAWLLPFWWALALLFWTVIFGIPVFLAFLAFQGLGVKAAIPVWTIPHMVSADRIIATFLGLLGVAEWILVFIVVPFHVGKWVARNAPGKEVSVWVMKAALSLVLGLAAVITFWSFMHQYPGFAPSHPELRFPLSEAFLINPLSVVYDLPCLAGAIWMRRKRQHLAA